VTCNSCNDIGYNDTCRLCLRRCFHNNSNVICRLYYYAVLSAMSALSCQTDAVYPVTDGAEKICLLQKIKSQI